jgi:ABC-type phosphate transport system substrate-binding protein
MRRISKLSVTAAGVFAVALGIASPAYADYGPSGTDIVGVGSDTVQNIGNFVADGDYLGHTGYNAADNPDKWVSFDATPDANDRAGYANGSTPTSPKPLNPTIVLRAGSVPVQRPNGSGAGIAALLADTTAPFKINYVRSSRLPSPTEQNTAGTDGFGFLHVVQTSDDPLEVAFASASSDFPSTGLSAQQLVGIYQCTTTNWSAVGGTAGTIIPLMPQSGSGTGKSFLADLQAANGGTAITVGGCVQIVEENDPLAITSLGASAPNAVEPMSLSRLKLWSAGYFHDPSVVFPGGGSLSPGVTEAHGCPTTPTDLDCEAGSPPGSTAVHSNASDGHPIYNDLRGLYYIFRDHDASTAPAGFNGTTLNWVQALLSDPSSPTTAYLDKHSTQALIAAGGATPLYNDLGNVHS